MSARIDIEDLSRSFAGRPALRSVSLRLEPGTTTTLVGASGSGKTTLLRCLAGLLRPDAGRILFDGTDVTRVPAERRGVGLVFQSYALFPHLTVAENLSFGLDVRGWSPAEAAHRVRELADELGLERLLGRRPPEISGGERQRVALGRALAYRPVLLLLDEPLAALDPNLAATVREALVRTIARERTTVLLVTHDRADALRLGDRVALLREGALEQAGTPRELYRVPRTEYAANFFGPGSAWRGSSNADGGAVFADTPLGRIPLDRVAPGPVVLVFRPEAIRLDADGGVPGSVRRVSYEGDRSRVVFDVGGWVGEAECPPRREFRVGDPVRVAVDPGLVVALPSE